MPHTFDAVLFDFDYTLADSSHGATECINYALRAMGLPAVTYEQACRTIGLSLPAALVRLAGEPAGRRAEEFTGLFIRRADEVMADLTNLYPETEPVLRAMQRAGLRLGVVSTKFRRRIVLTLGREGLDGLFDVIIGGEDVARPKPDPEGLRKAVERLGAPADRCLYVGDSLTDAEAARRAGLTFAAVLTGTTLQSDFSGYPVRAFLPSLAGLPSLLGLGEKPEATRD